MSTIKTKSAFSSRCARIAVLLVLLVGYLTSSGDESTGNDYILVDGIYYKALDDYNVCVTYKDKNYNSYAGWVFVPETWQGPGNRNIIGIGECAFKDCSHMDVVNLKNNILFIDSCAFQNCNIEYIYIPSSVTSIGNHAFEGCTSLSDVRFYGDILNIPDGMFKGCTSLKTINFPNSLTSIGDEAFMGSGFKQLTIGGALTSIGDSAFVDCANFTRLIIPAGSKPLTIGYNAFAGSSLTTITCEDTVPPVLTNGIGLTPEQMKTVRLIVPTKSACEAYSQAQYWKDFDHIEGPNYDFSVNHSGQDIYYRIIGDDEVCITYKDSNYNSYQGNYVEDVYDFYEDFFYQDQRWHGLSIPHEVTYNGKTYRVTAIDENAFRDCTSINKINMTRASQVWPIPIKTIGANAFKGCTGLRSVSLPEVLETIGDHAFEGCANLHVISFPSTVNKIDSCAFMNCSRLVAITLKSPMQIGSKAFSGTNLRGHELTGGIAINCTSTTPPVLADSTVFDVSHYTNSIVKVLYSLVGTFRADEKWNRFVNIQKLPYDFKAKDNNNYDIWYRINNENEVGVSPDNEVIYGTYGYGNRDIPETVNYQGHTYRVTSVENRAFYFSSIDKVVIPNSVKRIGDLAFGKSNVEEVILGDSVETIGIGAFNETPWLRKLHFPKSVKEIGDSALFNTTALNGITVDRDNPYYDSREDCNALIETATNRLIAGGGNCTEIPSSVTSITDYAFYGKKYLSRISIPGSIRRVGLGAFGYCDNLYQVTFSEPTKCIGAVAFAFSGLTSVVIPNSVDTIEEGAFAVCQKLKKVTLGSGLKYLGAQAFGKGNGGTSVIDTVVCYAATPPRMGAANCFSGAYNRATLLVPQASLELYKNDPNWSQFYKIVAVESSGINEISVDDGTPWERYNLQGLPVGDDYRGIVIENGRKILKP